MVLMLVFTCLGGCATSYHRDNGISGGYRDIKLNKDTYNVSFRGNGYSSKEHVQEFLIKRCAQLTLENHYRYFGIIAANTDVDRNVGITPTTIRSNSMGNFSAYGYGNSLSGFGYSNGSASICPGHTYEIDRYTSSVTMKMLADNKTLPDAFDAWIIVNNKG